MTQLARILAGLGPRQKVSIVLAAVLVGGSLLALARWKRERDFRVLYSGLSAEDAGVLIDKLRESGIEHRLVDGGTTVLVPSSRVAEVRLRMAAAGLPKSGRIGFELFDKTNFGLTEFAERVNYRRALEGELERSIASLVEVEQARVHVTFPKDSVFLEARQPAKASVLLKLRPGARLSAGNVQAISQLVASAVEGLAPESVAVLDMRGNLLSRARRPGLDGEDTSEAALEHRQRIERELLAKISSTLEPVLGAERYRASVLVDCDRAGVRRISVAVLIDHNLRWEGSGAGARRILEPPPPERMKAIRELVAAAAGIRTERGDQLLIESLPFETTLSLPPPQEPSPPSPRKRTAVPWWAAAAAALGVLVPFVVARLRRPIPSAVQEPETDGRAPISSPAKPATETLARQVADACRRHPASAARVIRRWLHEAGSGPRL